MGIIVGIDIGGSTTKIVGLNNGKLFSPLLVKATDPLSSVYGALGKFLNENKLQLSMWTISYVKMLVPFIERVYSVSLRTRSMSF